LFSPDKSKGIGLGHTGEFDQPFVGGVSFCSGQSSVVPATNPTRLEDWSWSSIYHSKSLTFCVLLYGNKKLFLYYRVDTPKNCRTKKLDLFLIK